VLLLKRQHVQEKETLPLRLQKEVQLQGEESALPVRRRAAPREKAEPRKKAEPREKHLREKAALRNEKDKQSLTLIAPFLFF